MEEKLDQLKQILHQVSDLHHAEAVLGWDHQTYLPEKGSEERGEQLATISEMAHQIFTSEKTGNLLSELAPYADQLPSDSTDARLIAVTQREYEKKTKVPSDFVAEFSRVTTVAQGVWEKAKNTNDFALFQPYLGKIIDLQRSYTDLFKPYDHIYDPLLDDYEPGLKTRDVQNIFNTLRPQQVELIRAISSRPQINAGFLHQKYDEDKQWQFGIEVASKFGMEWSRSRQDKAAHPFTTSFGLNDVRITTRVMSDYLPSALFSTMHESGHAMYELGFDPAFRRTPLADGASMAVHESQSRLWENLVGRSFTFWQYFYPRLQQLFPTQLENIALEQFYQAINKVEPSFVRTESDEATYNLHIMLRLELEIALIEGSLEVKDLPEVWNTRFKEYFGITPPNNSLGVLQDVHWSSGLIGYFPTYALGNLISVQLWEKIEEEIPSLDEQIGRGEFQDLLGWLRKKVHVHGKKYEPQQLVQLVTGSKIDPQPYMRYLNKKYRSIYHI